MKTEDYLWDKTGSDAEIERLENALAVFRYKESAPPEIPAKVLAFEPKEKPRSFYRFAYAAAAACVAYVVISAFVWLAISNWQFESEMSVLKVESPAEIKISQKESVGDILSPLPVSKIETPKQIVARKTFKPRTIVTKRTVQNTSVARNKKLKQAPDAALTDEEKFAYNQLMLALSITGSKLKLVTDKYENPADR